MLWHGKLICLHTKDVRNGWVQEQEMGDAKGDMLERQSTLLAEMGGILDDSREVRKSRVCQLCLVCWLSILTVRERLCYSPRVVDIQGFSIIYFLRNEI